MSDAITKSRASTLARTAEAMLRALGGTEVVIRCPVARAGDAENIELGIEGPATEDLAVSPVVMRAAEARSIQPGRFEFLFAPGSLAAYVDDRGQTPEQFFASALGIVSGQQLLHIENMTAQTLGGRPYLYRVVAAE